MWDEVLQLNQINRICFVMVDANYQEVAGLGAVLNLFISKNGMAFVPSAAALAEIGNGWYTAVFPATECDTIGPLAVYVTGAGCLQQNLEYVVEQRNSSCIDFTYTLINILTGLPIDGAEVWITTDAAGHNVIWNGITDVAGVAKDVHGNLPCVDAGTRYFWATRAGMIANAWPDIENVS